ncbi:MAG TPA: MFS transporter [Candidatus Binataceae bacterium]|nr:MFS transporter [Candidatus Binataceae bacterium]
MQTLDSTVIATALPAIAQSMHQDPIRLNLAITSYLLSLAVFIPISGWMADRFGARGVFRSAIVLFTFGSVLCGLSSSLSQLVCARILQGFGGAMMVPVGRLLVLKTIPKADLVEAMSYLTVPAVLGPVVGPPVGGFIVTYGSWRWIFLMNVPIGALGIVLVTLYIEDIRETQVFPLDIQGFVLTGLGLAGLVFGFETLGRGMVPTSVVMSVMAAGGICGGLYFLHSRRISKPIVDLDLMRIPTFAAATLNGALARMGIGALPFLLAMLLQLVFGLTPFASGLITFASAAGALTMKLTVTPIIRRWGFRRVLIGNGSISAIILMFYAGFRPSTPYSLIILTLLVGGFFRSLQFTALNTLTYADVPQPMMSGASTLASMAQQLSVSLGVSVAALLLHMSLSIRSATVLNAHDFVAAFLVTGVLSLISALLFLTMSEDAGWELRGGGAVPVAKSVEAVAEAD